MAWQSLGKDTPRRGDKPIEWMERTKHDTKFAWNIVKRFLSHLKSVAKDRQTSVSQMLRYVMAVETGYKAPVED